MIIYTDIVFYLGSPAVIVMYFWIFAACHMAYFQQDLLRTYFKTSPGTLRKVASKGDSLFLAICSSTVITFHVTFHKHHIRLGDVSTQDILNLPVSFRRKCVVLTWMQLGSLTIMLLLAIPLTILKFIEKF